MAETIWKFPLEVVDEQSVEMPAGASPLTVQVQKGEPCLWARVNPANERMQRRVFIHGTGHPLHADAMAYLATFQLLGGTFVGHVFLEYP